MHNDYADRKNGRQTITYLHPDLADVLSDTYGLMIYQESMLRVAQRFAGYTLVEAETLRKAAGKKVRAIMAQEREKFVAGCEATGYGTAIGTALFDIIEPFADYAFGKSHAFGYGLVAYWTAWLKANHPVEYMACLLTSVKDDKDRMAVYLAECRTMGIEVLVPDINLSVSEFRAVRAGSTGTGDAAAGTAAGGQGNGAAAAEPKGRGLVPFGMAAIRNVGEGLVERIVVERDAGGPFKDFYDFCNRVDPVVLNKRTVESLVKAGAFDSLGHPRQGLCLVLEQVVDRTLARRREADQGVLSLFGERMGGEALFDDSRVPIPDQEFDKHTKLAFEKEMLGLYVSDHPLVGAETALRRHADCTILDLREDAAGRDAAGAGAGPVGGSGNPASSGNPGGGGGFGNGGYGGPAGDRWVAGVVTGLSRKYTRRGELMATFVLEDLQSSIEVFVFPRTMTEVGYLLADDAVVCVKGRLDLRDDVPKVICSELKRPQLTLEGAEPLRVVLPVNALDDERVSRLKDLLGERPGGSPVYLHVGSKVVRLAAEFSVDITPGLLAELRVLLGPACLWNGGPSSG
jgi:DNA polymerase III subunit alpha